ncbi:helix-hairpin-helix domain-containing protein [Streptomyces sp. NPDC006658]|uniref:helix-hairpin-helix domain-containing protein n=1 Tax=Streptomyces sp. NPDC006658 TaxID=3156900 RepID=UPI0033C30AAD
MLCALGIRGTGRSMSRRVARHFATMDLISAANTEVMQRAEGIGAEKAPVILAELAGLAEQIDRLAAAGLSLTGPDATAPVPEGKETEGDADAGPLAGMRILVTHAMTGSLADLSRNRWTS